MRDQEKNAFKAAMDQLRARYGTLFGGDAEWKLRLSAYFEQLRKHDLNLVELALIRAPQPDFYPDKFPTAGQVQRLVIAAELERAQQVARQARNESAEDEDERVREELSLVPTSDEAQALYIAAAKSPAERLAREWQCESKRLGLDPTKPSPPDVAARRMRQMQALLDSFPSMDMNAAIEPRRHRRAAQPPTHEQSVKQEYGPGSDPDESNPTAGIARQQETAT